MTLERLNSFCRFIYRTVKASSSQRRAIPQASRGNRNALRSTSQINPETKSTFETDVLRFLLAPCSDQHMPRWYSIHASNRLSYLTTIQGRACRHKPHISMHASCMLNGKAHCHLIHYLGDRAPAEALRAVGHLRHIGEYGQKKSV